MRRHFQCQNIKFRQEFRCCRGWLGASLSMIYRDTGTDMIVSLAGTIGAKTMWHRCHYRDKISLCPIGMERSLVSLDIVQSVAIQRLVLMVIAIKAEAQVP